MARGGAQIDVSLIVDARKLLMKYYLIVDRHFLKKKTQGVQVSLRAP